MKRLIVSLTFVFLSGWTSLGCGSGGEDCTPYARTICRKGVTYWIDSCGNQGDVAETCECECNLDYSGCESDCGCTPDCIGKECGPDGCGGNCTPGCSGGATCNEANGQCEHQCNPSCDNKECGPDGCGGTCSPGCGGGETCNDVSGQCSDVCNPACSGRECGPDGCGGSCTPGCSGDETCNEANGLCEYQCNSSCDNKECGPDGCGGTCSPGCETGETCNESTGQCELENQFGSCTMVETCSTSSDCCPDPMPGTYVCNQDYPYIYSCDNGECASSGCSSDSDCTTYFEQMSAVLPENWRYDGCVFY